MRSVLLVPKENLEKVIDYLYEDEKKNFEEQFDIELTNINEDYILKFPDGKHHIFYSLIILKKYLEESKNK